MRFVLRWTFTVSALVFFAAFMAKIAGYAALAEHLAAFGLGCGLGGCLSLFVWFVWIFTKE